MATRDWRRTAALCVLFLATGTAHGQAGAEQDTAQSALQRSQEVMKLYALGVYELADEVTNLRASRSREDAWEGLVRSRQDDLLSEMRSAMTEVGKSARDTVMHPSYKPIIAVCHVVLAWAYWCAADPTRAAEEFRTANSLADFNDFAADYETQLALNPSRPIGIIEAQPENIWEQIREDYSRLQEEYYPVQLQIRDRTLLDTSLAEDKRLRFIRIRPLKAPTGESLLSERIRADERMARTTDDVQKRITVDLDSTVAVQLPQGEYSIESTSDEARSRTNDIVATTFRVPDSYRGPVIVPLRRWKGVVAKFETDTRAPALDSMDIFEEFGNRLLAKPRLEHYDFGVTYVFRCKLGTWEWGPRRLEFEELTDVSHKPRSVLSVRFLRESDLKRPLGDKVTIRIDKNVNWLGYLLLGVSSLIIVPLTLYAALGGV